MYVCMYVVFLSSSFSIACFPHVMRVFMYRLRSFHIASPFRGQIFLLSSTLAMVSLNANFLLFTFFFNVFYLENAIECNVFVCKHVSLSIVYFSLFPFSLFRIFLYIFFYFFRFMTDTYKVIRNFFSPLSFYPSRLFSLFLFLFFFIVNCICKSFPSISI